jgi:Ni,Fe-hydrogenase III large subunit
MDIDARYDFPATAKPLPGKIDCENFTGDVLSRAKVRYPELKRSHEYLFSMLDQLSCHIPAAEITDKPLQGNMLAVHVTEAWRGELCHAAVTGGDGRFRILKIVDPSFHNWEGLAMALRDGEISDFPICNKSFNLSYCGHDL